MIISMQNFTVFGYARTKINNEELRNIISQTLTCRIDKRYELIYCFAFAIQTVFFASIDAVGALAGKIVMTK